MIARFLPDVPAWPQLPERSFLENMYVQFSEGFPGVVVEDDRIYVDRTRDLDEPLERLYATYLDNAFEECAFGPDYAAGFYAFLDTPLTPLAVKGQVTGPVSWGLTVTDQDRRSVLYDETLADAAAKLLRLKASWQEMKLRELSPNTIIFVDEPYMDSFGSAYVPISRQQVIDLLEEVFGGISGPKGIHCCGNTDWSVVLSSSLDVLSFDAYDYGHTVALFPAEVKAFVERGGVLAWGIVPNQDTELGDETAASLIDRLDEHIGSLDRQGVSYRLQAEQSLLTPACGLASLSPEGAAFALELLSDVAREFRKRYIKEG